MFNAKNPRAHASSGSERSPRVSPNRISTTPLIIGLRTCRYTPATTRCLGGSHGASVPRPRVAKWRMVATTSASPQRITTAPGNAAARLREGKRTHGEDDVRHDERDRRGQEEDRKDVT